MLKLALIAAAAALALLGLPAAAQDWKAQYPELTLGVIPAENASGDAVSLVSDASKRTVRLITSSKSTAWSRKVWIALRSAGDRGFTLLSRPHIEECTWSSVRAIPRGSWCRLPWCC